MVAGFAPVFRKQARRTVLLEAAQQTKHLAPLQPNQRTGITDAQTARLNLQQHLKTAELLLAHRQHRQGAPPGTPEPGGVSPLLCRGVSSLYCAYTSSTRSLVIGNSAVAISFGSGWKISCARFSSASSCAAAAITRIVKVDESAPAAIVA